MLKLISRYANEEQQKQRQFRGWKAANVINQVEDDDEALNMQRIQSDIYIFQIIYRFSEAFKTQQFFIFKLL